MLVCIFSGRMIYPPCRNWMSKCYYFDIFRNFLWFPVQISCSRIWENMSILVWNSSIFQYPQTLLLLQDKIPNAVDDTAVCSGLISQFIRVVLGTRSLWIKNVEQCLWNVSLQKDIIFPFWGKRGSPSHYAECPILILIILYFSAVPLKLSKMINQNGLFNWSSLYRLMELVDTFSVYQNISFFWSEKNMGVWDALHED